MDRYGAGDEAAFAAVYDALAPRLYGYVLRQTRDSARAEDFVRQTMLHIHRARVRFIPGAEVLPWALAIARRLTIDDVARGNPVPVRGREIATPIERALARLSPSERAAFELLKYEGLSAAGAAQVLGTTGAAVKGRAQRAEEALRLALGDAAGDVEEGDSTSTPLPSPELRARVLAAARREPVAAIKEGASRRVAVVLRGFAVAGAIAIAAGIHGSEAKTPRPLGCILSLELLWLSLAVAATWAGVDRGRSMLGRPKAWRVAVAALTPAAMLAAWLPVAFAWPQTLVDTSGLRAHLLCVVTTMALAAGPLIAFAWLRRGSDPASPRLTGAALGAAAGAWGDAAHVPICGYTAPAHIIIGHILPVALLALVGVIIGDRVVALRAEAGLGRRPRDRPEPVLRSAR
jgi:RNA polymerase sigma-70 factor (ECF subfamily)